MNTASPPSNAPWCHVIQRIADLIRTACRNSYTLSSQIAVDEAMMAFNGRSRPFVDNFTHPAEDRQR